MWCGRPFDFAPGRIRQLKLLHAVAGEGARATENLPVRNHPLNFAEVAGAYQRALAQLAFSFFIFRRQDVAQVRMSALHFPGPGFLEALGRALVRF